MRPIPILPILPILLLALGLTGCRAALRLSPDDSDTVLRGHAMGAPDPSRPGPFRVRTLYYGSGTDRRRPEFRDSVAFRTETVDASKLVTMTPAVAKERRRYWGFEPKNFPLNARVWYPDGEGPFPLVLIVHGNHDMKEFSDPGYAYLGELLASRGYIVASVDMNFVNGALRGENDARGWLLLQHLVAWRSFNESEGNPLRGRVDLDEIALIGHSRGGEAVGHAAAFNRLKHYPDDASVRFDFGFAIRSLVAIAPVDGQYRPADRLVPVENVNYLVFHGSHDGDVTSFTGLRQYQRIRFTEPGPYFKAAVYMYRANHGQWNSVWGARDSGPRSHRSLDLRGLVPEADQRRFAMVYVSAFLEATLGGDTRYVPLFRDHRLAGDWLPRTMYVTRFQEATFRSVAGFEEDVDVTSGSLDGVVLRGDSLATWREAAVPFRAQSNPQSSTQENHAVWIGWNNRIAGDDTTRTGPPATYSVRLPDTLATRWPLDSTGALSFLLAATRDLPPARRAPPDSITGGGDAARSPVAGRARTPQAPKPDPLLLPPIDLTIELVDAFGGIARLPLSRYGVARRPLETRVLRRADRERARFTNLYELVLQSFTIPLSDAVAEHGGIDPSRLVEIRFVFDRTHAGTIVLDEIGFSMPDEDFLAGRLH